jgi:hypothetical protein
VDWNEIREYIEYSFTNQVRTEVLDGEPVSITIKYPSRNSFFLNSENLTDSDFKILGEKE